MLQEHIIIINGKNIYIYIYIHICLLEMLPELHMEFDVVAQLLLLLSILKRSYNICIYIQTCVCVYIYTYILIILCLCIDIYIRCFKQIYIYTFIIKKTRHAKLSKASKYISSCKQTISFH